MYHKLQRYTLTLFSEIQPIDMSKFLKNLFLFTFFAFTIDGAPSRQLKTIFLRLYNGNDINPFIDQYLENINNLVAHIDTKKKTVIYIHGFTESINSSSVRTIVDAYTERSDHNILAVDWSELARESYFQVVSNVEDVGTQIANAITSMSVAGVPVETIHVIGHSMGAHVAGTIGRKSQFIIPRITGLDPAGPLFNLLQSPLSASDAKFVDIIHTDAGLYGIARITGTVDFWPNRGTRIQPGCPEQAQFYTPEDFCSHHRSWIFYAESLKRENAFLAVKCSFNSDYSKANSEIIPMGYSTPFNVKGSFCLITSDKPPYGMSQVGAQEQ